MNPGNGLRLSVPVTGKQFFTNQGIFRTIVIENGKLPHFQKLADRAGYGDGFFFVEQGYEKVKSALGDSQSLALG